MGMKVYSGRRDSKGFPRVAVINEDGDSHLLNWRLDLVNHSPTGLNWGFLGSGPSQLALAILADATDDTLAVGLYQAFAQRVVAALPHDQWRLTRRQIWDYLREFLGDKNVDTSTWRPSH